MNQALVKRLLIFSMMLVIMFVFINEIFKMLDLSLKSYKPFKYNSASKTKKSDWYNWIEPLAKAVGKEYGIPWQAILVQSALETGWGSSSHVKYNNFNGVKDTDGKNAVNSTTKEFINGQWITIKDGFETWPTPYEGLRGYAEFIHKNKRYKKALLYPNDPYQYIVEIKNAGYATSPNYISILHGMLKTDLKVPRS